MERNALIMGDSYSTFAGFIPEGYAAYYSEEMLPENDVCQVEQTWWHSLITQIGANLALNDSWSGSTISYAGRSGDCSETSSFIARLHKLQKEGFFDSHDINTVFVFGGTNDSWINTPLGELKYENAEKQELFEVLPAVGYFLKELRSTLPNAEIYCLINTELNPKIAEAMKTACEVCNITAIAFDKIDKRRGHPTVQGMQDIKNQILPYLCEK